MRLFMRGLAVPPLSVTPSTCTLLFFCAFSLPAQEILPAVRAQHLAAAPSQHTLSLDPLTDQELASQALIKDEKTPRPPASFREFGSVQANQVVQPKRLTLRFAAAATLTKIESTPDFKLEQGGSCLEGNTYAANATCTLMVRFTPQGPGRRTGKLAISNSADPTPLSIGIGGYGFAPAISFTPSVISTVPGTFVSGVGLLSGAGSLAVDNGDALYVADTGNQAIRYLGSSGTWQSLYFDEIVTDPEGIAIDSFDDVFLSQDNPSAAALSVLQPNEINYFYTSNTSAELCGDGNSCSLSGAFLSDPGSLASDPSGNIFLAIPDYDLAYKIVPATNQSVQAYTQLSSPATDNPRPVAIAVDKNDAIYGYQSFTFPYNYCFISLLPYDKAAQGLFDYQTVVAGARGCGFSGDGGPAASALIGTRVGQMVFDQAGNLYFTDTSNNRVRRIDAATGIINTIAGNGVAGYGGDSGPATMASLNNPTGVAVDSQGQVYIISSSATTGAAQVIRKLGTTGALTMPGTAVGTPLAAQTITVANTGNAPLNFVHAGFSSGNLTDFSVDASTTSCNFTVPLASGASCKIGFIFSPTATGTRSAVYTMTDDTVTGSNTIHITGVGFTTATLAPATLSFATTTVGSSSAAQSATLTNTGKAVLTISSIVFSGAGAASYTKTTTCGTTLTIGASCTVSVTFKPSAAGTQAATLSVTDNAITQRQNVALSGTGLAAAKAAIAPAATAFATQMVGTASPGKSLTLTNPTSTVMTITSWTFSGANPADFTQTHTCGATLSAASSCTIAVTFSPAAAGTRTGTLTVATSAGSITATMTAIAITPTTATFNPAVLTFPATAMGSTSAPQTATLTNTGAAILEIASITLSGAENKSYSETTTCSATLAPGAHCTITVTFSPTLLGTNRVTLSVADNTVAVHQNVALTGVGETAGTTSLLKVSR